MYTNHGIMVKSNFGMVDYVIQLHMLYRLQKSILHEMTVAFRSPIKAFLSDVFLFHWSPAGLGKNLTCTYDRFD